MKFYVNVKYYIKNETKDILVWGFENYQTPEHHILLKLVCKYDMIQ